jgi:NAD(P)H dehydrogenase (quinone)
MILITGATGQLGRAVVEQLVKRTAADRVAAFVRDESKAADLKAKGVNLRVGSYDDIASLDRAMRGVDKVLLISGTEENRVQQHQNVVEAAKRAGVQLLAYTSRWVKGQDATTNPLMKSHFETEDSIKGSGLNYALLRNALYMDVIPRFVGQEKVFETGIQLPTGEGRVSYALRSEMGEAIANLLVDGDSKSRIHELTAGETWSYHDVADVLTELSGRKVKYTPVEQTEFEERMRKHGLPEQVIQRSVGFHNEVRKGLLDGVSPEMEHLLGRRPASLKEGLKVLFHL